jgi:hypothetical protein
MTIIKFETIWENYPSYDPCRDKKTGKIPLGYENQCAIRVSYALEKSGVLFSSFHGGRCPNTPKNSGMVTSAQELANWLGPSRFSGCSKPETYIGKEAFDKIEDRTGIIFLANYWQRVTDKGSARTGDHIDLWLVYLMKKSLLMFFFAIVGIFMCLGVTLVTDKFGIAPRFPVFAGEDDFSLRINYFLVMVFPAFFIIGAWIGYIFNKSRRLASYMSGGVFVGTVVTFGTAYFLSPLISNISSREIANYAVLTFFLSWILFSGFGAWVCEYASREKANIDRLTSEKP